MTKRDPHADNDLIDDMQDLPTPSHQGSAGGGISRRVGARDEAKAATGADPQPTGVEGRDKRDGGDLPTPPQRHR